MRKSYYFMVACIRAVCLMFMVPIDGFSAPGGGGKKAPKGAQGASGQPKNMFNIMMNYELGMHCTGFEFSYCCVLPPYNSILAQVVKTEKDRKHPLLLEGDPNIGLDFLLERETVLRDPELDANGNFKKYVLKYWHEAQPRNDGRGKPQGNPLISLVEGNSLLMWDTVFDAAVVDAGGALVYGGYNGSQNVLQGDGDYADNNVNYANAWLNHFFLLGPNVEGEGPSDPNPANNGNFGLTTLEANKIRVGVVNTVSLGGSGLEEVLVLPDNTGPTRQPMGPGSSPGNPFDNVLTWSGPGTVVYTDMKVVQGLPVMLTSPRIWEALGLPLTPFEDTIDFFGDPGQIDEDSIRPYVKMMAQLHEYDANCASNPAYDASCVGNAVLDDGDPVIGFGTAPIDIPNCERCHSAFGGQNAGNALHPTAAQATMDEIAFWNCYYDIDTGAGDSDWYSRLKGAAISILAIHDIEHGTSFTANWPAVDCDGPGSTVPNPGSGSNLPPSLFPQNTRLGHESVICQRCHADNVIAVVKSANCGPGSNCSETPADELFSNIAPVDPVTGAGHLLEPLTEAIHYNHRNVTEGGVITFDDSLGRDGGCQGCHPAHRSDGDLSSYPIDEDGNNTFAAGDNRDAAGGCYVGRDVHSNPGRNTDGAETQSYLNPVGQWLVDNVSMDSGQDKGIWCTNCHSQLGQELWKAENVADLVNAQPGDPGHVREPFVGATLADVAAGLGISTALAESWLDPKTTNPTDHTHAIWKPDPGMCAHVAHLFGAPADPYQDGNVATIEVAIPGFGQTCSTPLGAPGPDCDGDGSPDFNICVTADTDGDVNVNILDFCTTPDCVAAAQAKLDLLGSSAAVPVPMSAATDGRDHWLSPGEPHCADCHAAPFVEQSGNINFFPPFNYPRKASLFRYSRGHQDITCQGCHESIHGLYPVTPDIDTTSYAQAAYMNSDDSHGPLKCGACHDTNAKGVNGAANITYKGVEIDGDFEAAVAWAHTFTDEADPADSLCVRCHNDRRNMVDCSSKKWVEHARAGRVSRDAQDDVETQYGPNGICGSDPDLNDPANGAYQTVCVACHKARENKVDCNSTRWKKHLVEGRVSHSVWEAVSIDKTGTTCGW
jgi:hypothetical protein